MPDFDIKAAPRPRKKRKKENIFHSIITGLIPWKGDKVGDVVRKVILLVSIVVLVYAGCSILYFYVFRDIQNDYELNKYADMLAKNQSNDLVTIMMDDKDDTDNKNDAPKAEKEVEILSQYLPFYEKNNDYVGWVGIKPYVDYPVAQGKDNDFYLKHNFEKQPTANGTIFADYEGKITATEMPHNTILYGHNLLTKNFFQPLVHYRKDIEFMKANPIIQFDTLYQKNSYKIFSVFLTNTNKIHGDVFNYWDDIYFKDKGSFYDYVSECLDRSYYITGVDLQYGDELITLSTCDFSMFSDMRLVVVGRKVRENENPKVDTDKIVDNSGFDGDFVKRKMFDAYYETYGKQWAGRKWDTTLVKGMDEYYKEKATTESTTESTTSATTAE